MAETKEEKASDNIDTNEKKEKISNAKNGLKINKRPKYDLSDEEQDNSDNDDSVIVLDENDIDLKLSGMKKCGYFTKKGIKMWILAHPKEYVKNKEFIYTLKYNKDQSKPLYFWQLYSLLGSNRIKKIISVFYNAIFDDDNAKTQWFKKAFTRIGSLNHHIRTQSAFWVDAFGGGMAYHGGEYRLNFHHHHNASAVMNEDGAKLWLFHMVNTLNSKKIDLTKDPRVRPVINEFLRLIMNKYAHQFDFDTKKLKYQ